MTRLLGLLRDKLFQQKTRCPKCGQLWPVSPSSPTGFCHNCGIEWPVTPVAIDPAWLTPTAMAINQAIFKERAFDRLPVLSDALEEAGCDCQAILRHCRSGEYHDEHCWVVDLVMGRSDRP